jgi:2'-5' RNA ligase
VARNSRSEPRERLFVALDPPEDARAAIASWRDLTLGAEGLRPARPEAIHVTLAFLGYLPAGTSARIAACVETACAGAAAPRLSPLRLVGVPRRRPRLAALDLEDDSGAAARLQTRLSAALQELGLYQPEQRPFWPHLTLARAHKGAVVTLPASHPPPPGPFVADAVVVYRSLLRRDGAIYEPLASTPLARPPHSGS